MKPQLAAFIEAGQVSFTYKDFVLDGHRPRAQWAAEAVQCAADQDLYWSYQDHLFKNQKPWTKQELKDYAKALGMNTAEFNKCIDSGKHTETVNKMTNEAKSLELKGTPTIFINGKEVGLNEFASNPKALIEAELKK